MSPHVQLCNNSNKVILLPFAMKMSMDRSVTAEISSVCTGRRITVTCLAPGASTGRCAEDCTPTASIKSTQVWD